MNIIERNIALLKKLCIEHKVSKLYVFGSVNTNKFNNESDIDFFVTFDSIDLA